MNITRNIKKFQKQNFQTYQIHNNRTFNISLDYNVETFFINRIRTKVTGRYTGNVYCIGDSIKVVVKKCNTENRTIDLMFA